MGRGQEDNNTLTSRLLDQLGPEGRVGENPAYGRQRISQPMRTVGPIQFLGGCIIYCFFYKIFFERLHDFSLKRFLKNEGVGHFILFFWGGQWVNQ